MKHTIAKLYKSGFSVSFSAIAISMMVVAASSHSNAASAQERRATATGKNVLIGTPKPQVMKGVDSSGRTIYSDRPLEGVRVVEDLRGRRFISPPSAPSSVQTSADSARSSASSASSADLDVAAKEAQSAIETARKKVDELNAEVAKNNCNDARGRLDTLSKDRVIKIGDNGRPVAMSADEIETERQKVERQIAEFCR